jgi:hypothetical protein
MSKPRRQARVWKYVHLGLTLVWLIGGSLVTLLWLRESVTWVAWMSVYAIVAAHWSGYQGARAEDS